MRLSLFKTPLGIVLRSPDTSHFTKSILRKVNFSSPRISNTSSLIQNNSVDVSRAQDSGSGILFDSGGLGQYFLWHLHNSSPSLLLKYPSSLIAKHYKLDP